eukprot:9367105-Prorocentrum_lima.AAC.1
MRDQLNGNMNLMSHALPWHMTDLPPDAEFSAINSKLKRIAISLHPDKQFNPQVLCKMAGYSVQ